MNSPHARVSVLYNSKLAILILLIVLSMSFCLALNIALVITRCIFMPFVGVMPSRDTYLRQVNHDAFPKLAII
ncbi:hypothetical protein F5Y12DRAFT_201825 [Xylaria sp. FL1777]|nr:hypothetical protein F5Y12DRAFT_201825 [Xylaria sp. FL1777]